MSDQQTVSRPTAAPADASTAELVNLAAEQITRLVRDELALARAEMSAKARRFGTGAGLFGAAGFAALYGVGALTATVILLLALVLPAWAAALIVAGALFAIAAVVALVGRGELRRVASPAPEQTLDSVKADVQTVTDAVRKRGQ